MGYDLQTRRCHCNAVFKLATLRSRETECMDCMRKRSQRMTNAAVAAGTLHPVMVWGNRTHTDFRPATPNPNHTRVSTKFADVTAPGGVVRPGQFFETRNEAEQACPSGWELIAEVQGGYRIRPIGWRPERKPIPNEALPAPVDLRENMIDARIARAREQLEWNRQRRRLLEAHAQEVKAEQRGHVGTVAQGDKLYAVIADPSVPPGQVVLRWTDETGVRTARVPWQSALPIWAASQWGTP